MLTDLRYALGQLRRASNHATESLIQGYDIGKGPNMPAVEAQTEAGRDCVSRAIDALERCIEAAQAEAAAKAAYDAETDAMIEELCGASAHDLGGEA